MNSIKFSFAAATADLQNLGKFARSLIRPARRPQMVGLRWDRRRYRRNPVHIEARFKILRPRESYNAIALHGSLLDLSRSGARAEVSNLLQADYQQILRNPQLRYISVRCTLPGTGALTRLFGSIVHFDYYGEDVDPACNVGISFEEMEAHDRLQLSEFLQTFQF